MDFEAQNETPDASAPRVPNCIARVVDAAPELSEEQRQQIAAIVREPGRPAEVLTENLTPKELAAEIDVTEQTLRNWRRRGVGPRFIQPEGTAFIRYLRSDASEWVERSRSERGGLDQAA